MIGIKDFEMPKCCDDCLMKVCGDDGIDPYCTLTCEEFYHINSINTKERRGKECPLVELDKIEQLIEEYEKKSRDTYDYEGAYLIYEEIIEDLKRILYE